MLEKPSNYFLKYLNIHARKNVHRSTFDIFMFQSSSLRKIFKKKLVRLTRRLSLYY